jgi:hypothetical protein
MTKAEENKDGIADALKAMWAACEKEDWDTAAEEFSTAQSLADDDSDESTESDSGEGDDKGGGKGKGLMMAIFGKPKDEKK